MTEAAGSQEKVLKHWKMETENEVSWLRIDVEGSSTNVLSREVMEELEDVLGLLEVSPPRGLVIYSAKDEGFIAGADISEFPALTSRGDAREQIARGQRLMHRLEVLPCPSVAVMSGYALGGGLELALACTFRVAVFNHRKTLGLPEVQLGLHPGLGGTVRLPSLVGARAALELMLSGRPVTPDTALTMGLVDRVVEADAWREAAQELLFGEPPARKLPWLDQILAIGFVRPLLAHFLRRQVSRRARRVHYPAPYALIDLWTEFGGSEPGALDAEARSFCRLLETPTCKNLVRVFFLQERLKGFGKTDAPEINHVHVVGAGVMGGDIAAWCALKGLSVTLQDRDTTYVNRALDRADQLFRKKLSGQDLAATRKRLVADVTGEGIESAQLIIEAIFEDVQAKRDLFSNIESRINPDVVLASNTSSIPLEDIATSLADPSRLVGLHFFNPVAKLPLVEVVRARQTSPQALAAAQAFAGSIGKLPLPCLSSPGFLVNRILAPYMAEALALSEEGIPLETIDAAAVNFGMPMGPVELADTVGLDVSMHVAEVLAPVVRRPVAPILAEHVGQGRLGRKSGEGFYRWDKGRVQKAKVSHDPDQLERSEERLILALVNEAAHCLHQKIVVDADLVDAGVIFGTGFAPFRGGPLQYASDRGVRSIVASLANLSERAGDRYAPSQGWQDLKDAGRE